MRAVFGKWFEREDGSEYFAELTCTVTRTRPATHWEPAEGGYEVESLTIDDGDPVDTNQYQREVSAILEEAPSSGRYLSDAESDDND